MAGSCSAFPSEDRDGISIPVSRLAFFILDNRPGYRLHAARLLIGFYLLPGVVIAYPSGLLGRRFDDKRIAIFGMTLMVAGGALTASSYNYEIFLIGRLISGVGAVLLNVLLAKMVTDWFVGRELATALALLVSSWPVAIAWHASGSGRADFRLHQGMRGRQHGGDNRQ
jgi:MFS family permease